MKRLVFSLLVILIHGLSSASPLTYRRAIERVTSLDPAEAASAYASRCVSLIYEPLLEYDYEARPYALRPCLATAMPEISEDGQTYTFVIDTNACFTADPCFGLDADGAPLSRHVTAEDFVFSLKRLADAKVASSGYWLLDGHVKGIEAFREASKGATPTDYALEVEGLQAPAPERLVIKLSSPSPVFLWQMAMPYVAAVPREAVEFYGAAFRDHPVGTGPYALEKWRRNYSLRFRRNEAWRGWRETSNLKSEISNFKFQPFDFLYFPTIDDPSTQWLAFLAGELDLQGEILRDNWDDVIGPDGALSPALAERGIVLERAPTLEVGYIGINMRDPLLGGNKALRQALNAAFDFPAWERFYNGRIMPCDGPVPPSVGGRLETPFKYAFNLDLAHRLVAEAGYPGGIDPKTNRRLVLTLSIGNATQESREAGELMASFYEKVGIRLELDFRTWDAFLRAVNEGRVQLFRMGWVGDYPDAQNFLQLFYSKNASPGPNHSAYANPDFDSAYEAALDARTEPERNAHWSRCQEIIREDCPWVFTHYNKTFSLTRPSVGNFVPSGFPDGTEKWYEPRHR